jgi:hypothetical protein
MGARGRGYRPRARIDWLSDDVWRWIVDQRHSSKFVKTDMNEGDDGQVFGG